MAEVGFKDGVDIEDQRWPADDLAREVDRVGLALQLGLLDKAGRDGVVLAHIGLDLVPEIAGDKNQLVDLDLAESVEDVAKDWLAGHADKRLGFAIGVRTKPGAKTRGWDDYLHALYILRIYLNQGSPYIMSPWFGAPPTTDHRPLTPPPPQSAHLNPTFAPNPSTDYCQIVLVHCALFVPRQVGQNAVK